MRRIAFAFVLALGCMSMPLDPGAGEPTPPAPECIPPGSPLLLQWVACPNSGCSLCRASLPGPGTGIGDPVSGCIHVVADGPPVTCCATCP